jgi:phosphoserine phosphatase
LTEVAETNLENVEFLRAKLRELKIQSRDELDALRRDRDQMREYKQIRDEHNKEVKALIESVKAEREERDRINQEITEAKERRKAIHAQLSSIYEEIRELRSNLVGSPSTDQRHMMRRVEELEWRQQTEQLSRDEEISIVEEIARIETQLVKIGQEKEKQDRISEVRRLARKLKEEASEVHEKVLTLSEQSQVHHQEVVRIRPQLEEYKKSADTAHKNFVEWLKKVKDGEAKLKEQRTQIEDIQTKLRKQTVEKRDEERDEQRQYKKAQERERVESAVEKLQSGKRLTFDEFILAQRTVTDDKKRSKKKGRDVEKVVEEAASAPDTKMTTDFEPDEELEAILEESRTELSELDMENPSDETTED